MRRAHTQYIGCHHQPGILNSAGTSLLAIRAEPQSGLAPSPPGSSIIRSSSNENCIRPVCTVTSSLHSCV